MRIIFKNSVNIMNEYGDFAAVPLLIVDTKNILSIEKNRLTLINNDVYYASDEVINELSNAYATNFECYTID